jgi:hypothetical protein
VHRHDDAAARYGDAVAHHGDVVFVHLNWSNSYRTELTIWQLRIAAGVIINRRQPDVASDSSASLRASGFA